MMLPNVALRQHRMAIRNNEIQSFKKSIKTFLYALTKKQTV